MKCRENGVLCGARFPARNLSNRKAHRHGDNTNVFIIDWNPHFIHSESNVLERGDIRFEPVIMEIKGSVSTVLVCKILFS